MKPLYLVIYDQPTDELGTWYEFNENGMDSEAVQDMHKADVYSHAPEHTGVFRATFHSVLTRAATEWAVCQIKAGNAVIGETTKVYKVKRWALMDSVMDSIITVICFYPAYGSPPTWYVLHDLDQDTIDALELAESYSVRNCTQFANDYYKVQERLNIGDWCHFRSDPTVLRFQGQPVNIYTIGNL